VDTLFLAHGMQPGAHRAGADIGIWNWSVSGDKRLCGCIIIAASGLSIIGRSAPISGVHPLYRYHFYHFRLGTFYCRFMGRD